MSSSSEKTSTSFVDPKRSSTAPTTSAEDSVDMEAGETGESRSATLDEREKEPVLAPLQRLMERDREAGDMFAKEIETALGAPIPYEIKPKTVVRNDNGTFSALALGYISRHHVQNRLDEVVGPFGWEFKWTVVDPNAKMVRGSLSIYNSRTRAWATKEDVGAPQGSDEGDEWKGAVSDAFKRAATHFGVGRFLYNEKAQWVECEVATSRDGAPRTNKYGKFMFKKWTGDHPAGTSHEERHSSPSEPERPPLRPMAELVDASMEQYGVLTCRYCGGEDTRIQLTSGKGKRPSHEAVWCNNKGCPSQQYRGYCYPLVDAKKYNQPQKAEGEGEPEREVHPDDLPF